MTPDKLIKLLMENGKELSKHVRRLKVDGVEVEFVGHEPEPVEPEEDGYHDNNPLFDEATFSGGFVPVKRDS